MKPKKSANQDDINWISIEDAAKILKCSTDNVHRLARPRAKKPAWLRSKIEFGRKFVADDDVRTYKQSGRQAGRPKETT